MIERAPEVERANGKAIVHLHGDLVIATAPALDALLAELVTSDTRDDIELDFSKVGRVDASAVAVIELARRQLSTLELVGVEDRTRALFDESAKAAAVEPRPREPQRWLERVGARVLVSMKNVGTLLALLGETLKISGAALVRRARLPKGALGEQIATAGTDALPIISLLSFLLGMSLAFQGAIQLRRFGATVYVSDFISMTMVREFGPLLTAVIITGRSGAAIAAELGTMRVSSELDALEAMGINPVRYLVVPRVAALAIVQPILTLASMFVGIAGGVVVAALVLHMSPQMFWQHAVDRLTVGDFAKGLTKAFVCAWIIGMTAAHLGLRARAGASGVGFAATRAVVAAIFWIVVFDASFETVVSLVRR